MKSVFLKTAIFRVSSVIVVQTYFVADEYWQSLEVAHFSVFGYGYRTWEFREEIRSAAYPFIFSTIYKLLALCSLDYVWMLVNIPRILQAILSAYADACFFNWCSSFRLPSRDIWTVIILDWFTYFCCSRTLINTFETNLVVFGLHAFPWQTLPASRTLAPPHLFAFLVAAICFIRPTASLVWGPLCLLWVFRSNARKRIITTFTVDGFLTVIVLCLLDSIFYGKFTVTPWNFFKANVLQGVSAFYGSHPFYWYFTQGIPVVLGAFTLPFVLQAVNTAQQILFGGRKEKISSVQKVNNMMLVTITISLVAYSLVPHKEFRFLLPLQPMMMFVALQGLKFLQHGIKAKIFRVISLAGFLVPVLLFGQFHQRASLTVMKTLSTEAAAFPNSTSLLFLMPCHSTPWNSHLHVNIPARFLTCDPPIGTNTLDESQVFYASPKTWLTSYLPTHVSSHVVMFDHLVPELSDLLLANNFSVYEKHFHTLFPEGRVGKNIYIYRNESWALN